MIGPKTTLLYGVLGGALAAVTIGPLSYFAGYSYASFKHSKAVTTCQASLNTYMKAEADRQKTQGEDLITKFDAFKDVQTDIQKDAKRSAVEAAKARKAVENFEDELAKIKIPDCVAVGGGSSLRKLNKE